VRRWVCPQCGNGINGLERPRKDDVRRYCLDCSAKTGRLVERNCPALEKQRAVQGEKAAAKRNQRKVREREKAIERYMLGDLDLQREAQRLWRLPFMKEQQDWKERLPHIEFRRSATKTYTTGRSYGGRIVLTMGADPFGVREVLLHELVHEALPAGVYHSDPFYPVLVRAAREAWPHVDFPVGEVHGLRRAWDKDEWIRRHLAEGEA
jgi:hypothetical protein